MQKDMAGKGVEAENMAINKKNILIKFSLGCQINQFEEFSINRQWFKGSMDRRQFTGILGIKRLLEVPYKQKIF